MLEIEQYLELGSVNWQQNGAPIHFEEKVYDFIYKKFPVSTGRSGSFEYHRTVSWNHKLCFFISCEV